MSLPIDYYCEAEAEFEYVKYIPPESYRNYKDVVYLKGTIDILIVSMKGLLISCILIGTTWSFFAVDPASGNIEWSYPYYLEGSRNTERGTITTNTPLYWQDQIFITAGYDYPAVSFKLSEDGKSITELWRSPVLDNHHGHVVRMGKYLYGANWYHNSDGEWVCIDWNTGQVMWVKRWHTKGSIISAENRLYIFEERSGNVGLLIPDPREFKLSGTFRITKGAGPHWAHPAIFKDMLMIRHGDCLFGYNLLE